MSLLCNRVFKSQGLSNDIEGPCSDEIKVNRVIVVSLKEGHQEHLIWRGKTRQNNSVAVWVRVEANLSGTFACLQIFFYKNFSI